jgi:hypothetical protein
MSAPWISRRLRVLVTCLAAAPAISSLVVSTAHAEEGPPPPVDAEARAFATLGLLGLDGRLLDGNAPYRSAGLRFLGAGSAAGGGLEITVDTNYPRVGFEFGISRIGGVRLAHVPFGPDLSASLAAPQLINAAFSIGHSFRFGRLRPHLDLRVGLSVLRWEVDPVSTQAGPLSPLGGTLYDPLFAPRLGMTVLFAKCLVLDVAGSASPIGAERLGLTIGFGLRPTALD